MTRSNNHASTRPYIGRFAPSPTGPLHLGSLLTALASFLDARSQQGTWLVRMEDLDPPREMPGAADAILRTLEKYGLHWDGEVLYQSQRHALYEETVQQLLREGHAFYCTCSRKQLQELGAHAYPGTCRAHHQKPAQEHAIRVQVNQQDILFDDAIQGQCRFNLQQEGGDFIVHRRDGLYAYHLAVTVDDAAQNITHIVRGSDLLDSTPRHIHLQRLLRINTPHYAHLPVIVNAQGQKLSKQTFAASLPDTHPVPALFRCLQALRQEPPAELLESSASELLHWGITHWTPGKVPRSMTLPETALTG